jgi:hypothetical protein
MPAFTGYRGYEHFAKIHHSVALVELATQLGQILPYLDCEHHARYSAIISVSGAAVSCLAGAISWRSIGLAEMSEPRRTWLFVGSMSILGALVFAFALSMQGLAGLVLSGCER